MVAMPYLLGFFELQVFFIECMDLQPFERSSPKSADAIILNPTGDPQARIGAKRDVKLPGDVNPFIDSSAKFYSEADQFDGESEELSAHEEIILQRGKAAARYYKINHL